MRADICNLEPTRQFRLHNDESGNNYHFEIVYGYKVSVSKTKNNSENVFQSILTHKEKFNVIF
jgi:hypothetical protein